MEKNLFLGFDIGGTKCAVILGRVNGHDIEFLARDQFATTSFPVPVDAVGRMADLAEEQLSAHHIAPELLGGIGVSCGGPLSSARGVILSPPNLPGWDNVPVVELLARRFPCPVRLQNDANAGAVAEWKFGAGRGASSLAFLTFGTGLGAGLILDGRLYSGPDDFAGECGHIRLAPLGPVGYGKAGSFEGFCSGGGIAQLAAMRVREAIQAGRAPAWAPDAAAVGALSAKSVAIAADAGDALAIAIYEECGAWLGRGLAVLIDLLNLERIVIGSIFARSEALLRPAMERELFREALGAPARRCRIVPAELGERIGDYAALALARGEF